MGRITAGNQNRRKRTKRLPPVLLARDLAMATKQNLLGLVDLGREIGRPALVGMQFLHQRPVRPLDLSSFSPRRHAKDLVGLILGHLAASRRPLLVSLPRRRTFLRVLTPAGVTAVEISGQ